MPFILRGPIFVIKKTERSFDTTFRLTKTVILNYFLMNALNFLSNSVQIVAGSGYFKYVKS
jgi:hypothetical protein